MSIITGRSQAILLISFNSYSWNWHTSRHKIGERDWCWAKLTTQNIIVLRAWQMKEEVADEVDDPIVVVEGDKKTRSWWHVAQEALWWGEEVMTGFPIISYLHCVTVTRDQTAHLLKISGLTAFQLGWTCFWSCRIILTSWEWIVWLQKVTGVDHNLSLGVRAVIMMFVGLDFNNCWEMWLAQPGAQPLTSCVR